MRGIKGVPTEEMSAAIGDQPVARAEAVPIGSFKQLVREVARLSYLNKDHLLFFRGQSRDYRNKAGSSTVYPSVYRGERVAREQLQLAFDILDTSAARLCDLFESEGLHGHRDVRRRRYVQWSILQHYEVCPTPLLDLTHSLLVACSFAFLSKEEEEPFVFVFGLPYLTNRVSVNSEHDLVNVRLLSICPPEALRPYFQEGYLAGTDEILFDFDSKTELDFNNRLIAKFRLTGGRRGFWSGSVRRYQREILYPRGDRVHELCKRLSGQVGTKASPGQIGSFLQDWTALETKVMDLARSHAGDRKIYSLRTALVFLQETEVIRADLVASLNRLRRIRNDVVHRPDRVSNRAVARASSNILGLTIDLKKASSVAT